MRRGRTWAPLHSYWTGEPHHTILAFRKKDGAGLQGCGHPVRAAGKATHSHLQFHVTDRAPPQALDLEGNFSKAAGYIRSAAAQGCHLAVLPEYHLTSWVPEKPDFHRLSIASIKYLERYRDLARELDISIVPGTICEETAEEPRDEAGASPLANVAYFIAAGSGEICGRYQKKSLWHPERPHLVSSGSAPHEAFDTPLKHADGRPVRAGLLICWDLAFPEGFRALIADGADIIIIPSWWYLDDMSEDGLALNPDSEKIFIESATTSRAFENTAAIVFCNSGGLSCVTMPVNGCLGRLGVGEERMLVEEVDLDVLRVAEGAYKVREDMRSKDWHYSYTMRGRGGPE